MVVHAGRTACNQPLPALSLPNQFQPFHTGSHGWWQLVWCPMVGALTLASSKGQGLAPASLSGTVYHCSERPWADWAEDTVLRPPLPLVV